MIRRSLAVDFGTVNTLVYARERGVILREPTLAAVRRNNKADIAAIGTEAAALLKKDPEHYAPVMPLRDGAIADRKIAEKMLRYFLRRVLGKRFLFSPAPCVAVCVPGNVKEEDREALRKAVFGVGAWDCVIVPGPLAAAVGTGLPVNEPRGSMIVDIGGGLCETAVISLGSIVAGNSVCVGGNRLDGAIREYVRSAHGLWVTEAAAENIRISLGSAAEQRFENTMRVKGLRAEDKLPGEVMLTSTEIFGALIPPLKELAGSVKKTLEEASPELAGDILRHGMTLSGGASLLPGMDVFLYRMTGVPASLCEYPLDAAALGAGKIAEKMESMPKNPSFRKEAVYRT